MKSFTICSTQRRNSFNLVSILKTRTRIRSFVMFCLLFMSALMLQIQAQELWGMTSAGGTDRIGTIIKTDANGNNQSVVYSFKEETPGGLPHYTKLCQASNGKLYGMTREGGANDQGVLFEYDPVAITYTKKLDFDGAA